MILEETDRLPNWLKDELETDCPFCGSKYNIGLSPNRLRITKHYCPNKECPATVAMKMAFMWTLLGVDGIKYGRSMELLKTHKIKHHLDAIPYVVKDKIDLDIVTFMRISCVEGIDDEWNKVCYEKYSLEEVINSPTAQSYLRPDDVEHIKESSKQFNLIFPKKQQYDTILRLTVMMTGDIMGLENREYLISALNQKYKGLLDLRYSKHKRKTGMFALVKEESSATTGKVDTAMESGIPIMTPKEFILKVDDMIKERLGDNYDDYDI